MTSEAWLEYSAGYSSRHNERRHLGARGTVAVRDVSTPFKRTAPVGCATPQRALRSSTAVSKAQMSHVTETACTCHDECN
jgi:hypothetical protein